MATISEYRDWLAEQLAHTASWRRDVAKRFPDDPRNLCSARALDKAAEYVRGLDDHHDALVTLARLGEALRLKDPSDLSALGDAASRFGFGLHGTADFENLLSAIVDEQLEGGRAMFDPMPGDYDSDDPRVPVVLDLLHERGLFGGHYPGHVRAAFAEEFVDAILAQGGIPATARVEIDYETEEWPVKRFLDLLRGCKDVLPGGVCSDLDIPQGSSYRDAALVIRRTLELLECGATPGTSGRFTNAWYSALAQSGLEQAA